MKNFRWKAAKLIWTQSSSNEEPWRKVTSGRSDQYLSNLNFQLGFSLRRIGMLKDGLELALDFLRILIYEFQKRNGQYWSWTGS